MTPAFAYLQARLQAHHGRRLDEDGWQHLERVNSYRLFLKNARDTALAPWLQAVGEANDPLVVEQRLWEALRHSVAQVARWAPPEWQPAITWTIPLWQLPARRHLWQGQPLPPGLLLADADADGIVALEQAWRGGVPLLQAWLAHWRQLWPPQRGRQGDPLEQWIKIAQDHVTRFAALPDATAAKAARLALQQQLRGLFRRYSGQPAVLFVHLALMALDFARLRGDLVLRALYHATEGESA
ncbi:MAG: hypothetical protein HQL87_13390 [Magnetococcales bacterium]|nr:hypothetical protein [Magnetococcales bacterium]